MVFTGSEETDSAGGGLSLEIFLDAAGMDTLSILPLVLSNRLFIPALREFGIALYGRNPISFLYCHSF